MSDHFGDVPPRSGVVDRRRQRSQRSRGRTVQALLTLVRRDCEMPTAAAVAELAGLSRRTVFRLFRDLESLHVAANAWQEQEVRQLFPPLLPREESCDETIRRVVDHRVAVYEHMKPLRGVAQRLEHEHGFIAESLEHESATLRMHLRIMFHAHLPEDEQERWQSLELMTSWYSYHVLRDRQLCSPTMAKVVVMANVRRILNAGRSL